LPYRLPNDRHTAARPSCKLGCVPRFPQAY
jgi:hypothetical protein